MTKKDYLLIAKILKEANDEGNFNGNITPLINWFADDLELENPRFDRVKFIQASGVC